MSHVAQGLVDTPQTYSGTLNGKIVFTSGGHGWKGSGTTYTTDRPEYWRTSANNPADDGELVEDFGNQDQMTLYADYLLRAGATVVPMRPVGRQINEVIVDNDSAGATFSGSWSNSIGADYYDEDYGASADAVSYRFASTTTGPETSVATYTPNISSAGLYPVYTWVSRSANRTTQLYRINHTGGATEIRVDHSKVGYGWVYLGTYHFNSGSSTTLGSVQISNNGPAGKVVIADAIRFGNGMGDWIEPGATVVSGKPREDENSHHWIARMVGQGTTLDEAIGAGTSNVSAPSNMAEWMLSGTYNPAGGVVDAVYVGFHSNGTTGHPDTATARRAIGLITSSGATPHQAGADGLATILGRQINQDMHSLAGTFEVNWVAPPNNDPNQYNNSSTGSFGEIDLGANAEMDATIIEVAFHDNVNDNLLLRDPKARDQIARSVYQGTLEYFATWGGATNTSLPTPPNTVRVVSDASGEVTLNWAAGPSTPAIANGAAATSYKVYASIDGYGFDGGRTVAGTSTTITGLDPTQVYYFRVAGINAGGESKPSEVITALPSGGVKQVLIVNGFDRHERSQNFRYPYSGGDPEGAADRVWSRYNNSFDYVIQVHTAIHAAEPGLHVASTSNEAVISGAVNLNDYDTVIWILGEESTANDTFNATEQTKVEAFIAAGGNLFTSGSEIAWDLDAQSGGVSFFENTLKGNYAADDGGTYNITPAAGSIFAGMANFSFSQGNAFSQLDSQFYNAETPDVINPQAGGAAALTYNGGTNGTAAIQVQGTGGRGSIVMFGFPFETITSAARKQDVMERVLSFFAISAAIPEVDIKTQINGQDADSPTGPILAPGDTATFTYTLTNPGNVPLTGVVVSDDNGTPGNPGDDFAPSFTSGDTNGNSQLDVGETWIYTALRTVIAGQFTGSGSVEAAGGLQNVADADAANYFGSAPAVNLATFVDGEDADLPTGPILAIGSFKFFTYSVTNSGNIALANVVVTDDNGTPGNTADDFNPSYSGGDANSNNLLDLGETWTYSFVFPVSDGQYTSSASVTANDSINQIASNTDATNYFGSAPDVIIETLVNGDDADVPTGPNLVAGSMATFTYVVTNVGNIALSNVEVSDDNGTSGDTGDDFNPAYSSGDTNSNSLLDTDETWTFTALRAVTLGQFSNLGTVSSEDPISQVANGVDATNYLGIAPENADFNADGSVDSADYVVWRKFGGTTVPAGTLGDANYDTDVDEDDYLIYQQQYGTTPGGEGGSSFVVPPAAAEDTLSQDAAFSALATSGVDVRTISRPLARPQSRSVALAVSDEWPALLAAIAEQKAGQREELVVLGSCGVGNREIEILPAEPNLARLKVFARAKLSIRN